MKLKKKKKKKKKHILYIICINFLEFVAAKSNICSYRLKSKNPYSLLMFRNKTFMWYLEQLHRHVSTKMQQACDKNNFRFGETELWRNTRSNGYFSVVVQNRMFVIS